MKPSRDKAFKEPFFITQAYTRNVLAGLVIDQFQARGIYLMPKEINGLPLTVQALLFWIKTVAGKKINHASLLTANPFFNINAITGDNDPKVTIGTVSGLNIYKGNGVSLTNQIHTIILLQKMDYHQIMFKVLQLIPKWTDLAKNFKPY